MSLKKFGSVSNMAEAISWLDISSIEKADASNGKRFIQSFPDCTFYQEKDDLFSMLEDKYNTELPEWLKVFRRQLAWIMPNCSTTVCFREFSGWSPRMDYLQDLWYSIYLRGYSDEEERSFLMRIDDFLPFPIASIQGSNDSFLAVKLADLSDQGIYEYNLEDLWDNEADGNPVSASIRKVFDSYSEMLSSVAQIRIEKDDLTEIIQAK
jgi:hypothetical protein